jgi:hypothetical protein
VSGDRRRFMAEGFDLDLTYVAPRILAMGLPALGSEGVCLLHSAHATCMPGIAVEPGPWVHRKLSVSHILLAIRCATAQVCTVTPCPRQPASLHASILVTPACTTSAPSLATATRLMPAMVSTYAVTMHLKTIRCGHAHCMEGMDHLVTSRTVRP